MDRAEARNRLRWIKAAAETTMDREALDLAIEALQEKHQLSGETSTISEKESVEGDAESATTTDCKNRGMRKYINISKLRDEYAKKKIGRTGRAISQTYTFGGEDCISRADTIKAICAECTQEGYDECRADCTEVAIVKGMPPVTPTVSEDCISRQDAIEALMAHFIPQTYTGEQVEQAEKLAQKIMNKVPPATPTVKVRQVDTLIIAAALQDFAQNSERNISDRERAGELRGQVLAYGASMCQPKSKLDCISRRDALKPFCITSDGTRIPEVDCDNFPVEFSVKDIKRHLLSLPPVTPTERTGEWIENAPEGQDIDPPYICSICGHAESTRTPFCEQCGAKMKGGTENE